MAIGYVIGLWISYYQYYKGFLDLKHTNTEQAKEIKKIKANRDGLLQQFSIFKAEIEKYQNDLQLQNEKVSYLHQLLGFILGSLTTDKVKEIEKRKEVSKGLLENDGKKEKNDEDRKDH